MLLWKVSWPRRPRTPKISKEIFPFQPHPLSETFRKGCELTAIFVTTLLPGPFQGLFMLAYFVVICNGWFRPPHKPRHHHSFAAISFQKSAPTVKIDSSKVKSSACSAGAGPQPRKKNRAGKCRWYQEKSSEIITGLSRISKSTPALRTRSNSSSGFQTAG